MRRTRAISMILGFSLVLLAGCLAAAQEKVPFKAGAKVFISPMPNGFDTYLKAAIQKKKVPVQIVETKEAANFELRGTSESQKASTAKKVLFLNWHSDEQASISVVDLQSGEVVFAYTANKKSSAHGKQSSAEACAKHLKEKLEGR